MIARMAMHMRSETPANDRPKRDPPDISRGMCCDSMSHKGDYEWGDGEGSCGGHSAGGGDLHQAPAEELTSIPSPVQRLVGISQPPPLQLRKSYPQVLPYVAQCRG